MAGRRYSQYKMVLMKFFLFIIKFSLPLCIYSQELKIDSKKDSTSFVGVKVKIENFILRPPECGVMKFISVYKATFVQPNYIFKNDEILIFVTCREAYGTLFSPNKIYYIDFSFFDPNLNSGEIINYSGISIESMKNYKKGKLYKIKAISK